MHITTDSQGELIELPPLPSMLNPFPEFAKLAERGGVVRVRNPVGTEVYLVTRWTEAIQTLTSPLIVNCTWRSVNGAISTTRIRSAPLPSAS